MNFLNVVLSLILLISVFTLLLLPFSTTWKVARSCSLYSALAQLTLFGLAFSMTYAPSLPQLVRITLEDFTLHGLEGFVLGVNDYFLTNFILDELGVFFVFLTLLLNPICILSSWSTVRDRVVLFQFVLHLVTLLLLVVFTVKNLLFFYVAFESILIPMFFLIVYWGSRDRKIHAAYQFFLYTLLGSVLMLIALVYMYANVGSLHLDLLLSHEFDLETSRLLWFALFVSFAVKVPMIPFHIWLPEAHVEAPTAGSVLLAGILLKMGTYGLIRFSLPLFPEATLYYQPLVYLLSLIGIIYSVFSTIRQVDLKKIIAYSSVGHMNYVTLGIASGTLAGLEGSLFLMLGHGFVSSALFLCVGSLYERYHTRVILYYGGLIFGMPIFGFFFLLFTLANVSLPGTSNFVGEFLVLAGVFLSNSFVAFLAATAVIFSAVYAFWLYNRVMFGLPKGFITSFSDSTKREILLYFVLSICIVFAGIFPNFFLEIFHSALLPTMDRLT